MTQKTSTDTEAQQTKETLRQAPRGFMEEGILREQSLIAEDAEDGDEAMATVRTRRKKARAVTVFILTDIQRLRMNGYEAAGAARTVPGPADVPIPLISATAKAYKETGQNAWQPEWTGILPGR